MNKKDFKMDIDSKELKLQSRGMNNMFQKLLEWGIVDCKKIDLNPEKKPEKAEAKEGEEKKVEKQEKHVGFWIIQGSHKSRNGKKFNFQIVPAQNRFKENGDPQYMLLLQRGKDQCIATYPQTNPDLKGMILNYIYEEVPQNLTLVEEAK
jgi:hypothetical protein